MALLDDLVSVWELADTSDSFGTNTLSPFNVSYVAGLMSQNCSRFVASGGPYHEVADNAAISSGDIDFSIGAWVRLSSTDTGANKAIVAKWSTGTNQREYMILWDRASNRFQFWVSSTGLGTTGSVSATTFGAPASDGTEWCYVFGYHDAINNQIGISVNGGPRDTASHSGGVRDGTSQLAIGAIRNSNIFFMDGDIQQAALWKAVKSSADVTALYNGGLGLDYSLWGVGAFKPYWVSRTTQVLGGR